MNKVWCQHVTIRVVYLSLQRVWCCHVWRRFLCTARVMFNLMLRGWVSQAFLSPVEFKLRFEPTQILYPYQRLHFLRLWRTITMIYLSSEWIRFYQAFSAWKSPARRIATYSPSFPGLCCSHRAHCPDFTITSSTAKWKGEWITSSAALLCSSRKGPICLLYFHVFCAWNDLQNSINKLGVLEGELKLFAIRGFLVGNNICLFSLLESVAWMLKRNEILSGRRCPIQPGFKYTIASQEKSKFV